MNSLTYLVAILVSIAPQQPLGYKERPRKLRSIIFRSRHSGCRDDRNNGNRQLNMAVVGDKRVLMRSNEFMSALSKHLTC